MAVQHVCAFKINGRKDIPEWSSLCLLTWRYELPSVARTTPISNKFSWSQWCSSHWSSIVSISNKSSIDKKKQKKKKKKKTEKNQNEAIWYHVLYYELRHNIYYKTAMRPVKTQISLCSPIRVFAWHSVGSQGVAKILICLRLCVGWSESSLGAYAIM